MCFKNALKFQTPLTELFTVVVLWLMCCIFQAVGWRSWQSSGFLRPRRGSELAEPAGRTRARATASTRRRNLTAWCRWLCLKFKGAYPKTPRVRKSEHLMRVDVFRAVPLCCRCNLAGVMLQLMALGIPDVMNFDFMSKPSPGNDAFWLTEPLGTRRHIAVPTFLCLSRGRAFSCGAFGAAGSCGEEGRSGSPHWFGEEDGELSSRA